MTKTEGLPFRPFLVLGLPRSRTAWISKFLSYGDVICGHEQIRFCRSLDDVSNWFRQGAAGSAETAAAPHWRLVRKLVPDIKFILIRREPNEVVESLLRLDMRGTAQFDEARSALMARKLCQKLDQIERRVPDVTSIDYRDLSTLDGAERLWSAALPYPFDPDWFHLLSTLNIQISMPHLIRYYFANIVGLKALSQVAKSATLAAMMEGRGKTDEAIEIGTIPFDNFLTKGQRTFAQHAAMVGEAPDSYLGKNLTLFRELEAKGRLLVSVAQSNGRIFGYLLSILSPSLESPEILMGVHSLFFASPEFPGLGLRLQRFATSELRSRGVTQVWWKEGERADGPRIGTLARRQGASPAGQMFKLEMEK